MTDTTLQLLQNKLNETYELKPNRFNSMLINRVFVTMTKQLKTFPFKWYIPIAMVVTLFFWVLSKLTNSAILTRLASILQYGF